LEEFLDEARTLVRFSHPNIVRIRDFLQQKNSTHLVMDYYAGMSLAAYLKQQPSVMSQENAVALISPIFDALGQVQELGYLHRDIKPANI
jgi:serine/threonine protein kinase